MGDRASKDALFAEFAAVGKVLGNPKRLELLDLLAQGPRSVDDLASAAELGMSTCSAHLQTLREAGLVENRREGTGFRPFRGLAPCGEEGRYRCGARVRSAPVSDRARYKSGWRLRHFRHCEAQEARATIADDPAEYAEWRSCHVEEQGD